MKIYTAFACFLYLSVASAQDWLILQTYAANDLSCTGAEQKAEAWQTNTCIPVSSGSGYIYNLSSDGTGYNRYVYGSSKCTGEGYQYDTTPTPLNQCDAESGYQSVKYTTSSTMPLYSGSLQAFSHACEDPPFHLVVSFFDVCVSSAFSSSKTSYYGGDRCVHENFNSAGCVGTPSSAYADTTTSGICNKVSGYYYYYNTTSGYAVNGQFLKFKKQKPTPAGVTIKRGYAMPDCAGAVSSTTYSYLGCDGNGGSTNTNGTAVVSQSWDSANCTGHQIISSSSSSSSNTLLNQCQASYNSYGTVERSTYTTTGTMPSYIGAGVYVFAIQDKCVSPTVIYYMSVASPVCLPTSNGYSVSYKCSQNATYTTLTTNNYYTEDCTGTPSVKKDYTKSCLDDDSSSSSSSTNSDVSSYIYVASCGKYLPGSSSGANFITSSVVVMVLLIVSALL